MPYKGKELSMLIFLPKAIEDGATGLEKVGPLVCTPNWTCGRVMSTDWFRVSALSWRSCWRMRSLRSGLVQTWWMKLKSRWGCPGSRWRRNTTWRASWSAWAWWTPSTWGRATSLVRRVSAHLFVANLRTNVFNVPVLSQACPLPTTCLCLKFTTKPLWRSTRRGRRLLQPPRPSWCCAAPWFLPASSRTTPSSSSSDTTPPRTSSFQAVTALLSELRGYPGINDWLLFLFCRFNTSLSKKKKKYLTVFSVPCWNDITFTWYHLFYLNNTICPLAALTTFILCTLTVTFIVSHFSWTIQSNIINVVAVQLHSYHEIKKYLL